MERILEILEHDATMTPQQIAVMLDKDEAEVAAQIKAYEDNKTILGKRAVINWDKTQRQQVSALIELKVTPQRGEGFDAVAERIYQYEQVSSLYLMSGGFDIMVVVEGKTMQEVALFVAEKLAPMNNVISTATHFVLKKYKVDGVVMDPDTEDKREVMSL